MGGDRRSGSEVRGVRGVRVRRPGGDGHYGPGVPSDAGGTPGVTEYGIYTSIGEDLQRTFRGFR